MRKVALARDGFAIRADEQRGEDDDFAGFYEEASEIHPLAELCGAYVIDRQVGGDGVGL
jgi:hypothetical protein